MNFHLQKHLLVRTNIFICSIIIAGFAVVSFIGYISSNSIFSTDMEHVSTLTSESIYHQLDSFFAKPINVSLTMANDTLLKNLLTEEKTRLSDPEYTKETSEYLNAYKDKYGYDSIFLVSAATGRYYHFNGLDRILYEGDPENVWYYGFLNGHEEYSLNIDNDQAAENFITVFINCRIKDGGGNTVGVVGVGLRVEHFEELLKGYNKKFGLIAMLTDNEGSIKISSDHTLKTGDDIFELSGFKERRKEITANSQESFSFWNDRSDPDSFVITRYIPELDWYLIVENYSDRIDTQLRKQFFLGIFITFIITGAVIYSVNSIIGKYNNKLLRMTISQEQEYNQLLHQATEELYEDIYEFDITRDKASGENTKRYFESMGMSGDTPYSQALRTIARKSVKKEFINGYLDAFSPENVLNAYKNGLSSLYYDFMATHDGEKYRWTRIMARIFYWKSDQSVRMISFRQDIDGEKQNEKDYQYQQLITQATKELYENVYEIDITRNCAGDKSTMAYFESLGVPGNTPYDEALKLIAEKQIKEEHREGYLRTFSHENVIKVHKNGIDSLRYDFMISGDGVNYYWMRITTRIFYWDGDGSIRMLVFRQNIDDEVKREKILMDQATLDPLTGLYNKSVTEKLIKERLKGGYSRRYAFFILDIDNFKQVNDNFGHSNGDIVIRNFADILKRNFRDTDIVGRIGGDEFVVFLPAQDRQWVEKKARSVSESLCRSLILDGRECRFSASIGIAITPEDGADFETLYKKADSALYITKRKGRNGFTLACNAE